MALIPPVMINDIVMKYENKEKYQIYSETLVGKKPREEEKD